jgi:hypothetical protein
MRVRWAGQVARMRRKNAYRVLVADLKQRDHFEDVGIDVRITLKCVLKERR